jgi:hypothetical protein
MKNGNNNDEIVNRVLQECKILEDVLNNKILPVFADIHNINRNESKLKLKQEVVAKRSFFMDVKKRYSLYIINREGKNIEEKEVKGMSTQRSEIPKITREKIDILLKMIIEDDVIDYDKIKTFISNTRGELLTLCEERNKLIAGAAHFSKPLKDYKQIPTHVKGMLLWNNLEYDYFSEVSKGYLFKIKGVDTLKAPSRVLRNINLINNKTTNIVIPFEEEILPEYYVLDIANQIRYSWDDRATEVMRVLEGVFNEKIQEALFELFEDDN